MLRVRNRRTGLSATVVVVLLLIAVMALRVHPRGTVSACKEDMPTQVASPDGRWVAVQVIELCQGALRSQSTKVILREGGEEKAVVFEMAGVANVDMAWKDARRLSIGYPESAELSTRIEKLDEVSIEYAGEKPQ